MKFNKNYFSKIIYNNNNKLLDNKSILYLNTIDLTYLLEKLNLFKLTSLMLNNFTSIKIQENIFFKYIIFLNKKYIYNTYIYKHNPLINLHKYLTNKFPIFNSNINMTNNIFFQELNTQLNYIKTYKPNKHNSQIIKTSQLHSNLKSIEYIFELYSSKHKTNLISPINSFILNFNKINKYSYYIEIPLQNLIHNLNITILSNISKHSIIYLKTLNTLTIGGDTLYLDTFSPNLITVYYHNILLFTMNLYQAVKNTSIYIYNLILESLIKQYQFQGIILPAFLFELIVKRMTNYVQILNSGDTLLTYKDIIPSTLANLINQSFISNGLIGSVYGPVVVGISKISLSYSGLLSSISFQETLKTLSKLVFTNQIDWILDLKSKILLSDLLDTGTGWYKHYNVIARNF